jgi:dodecin
LKIHANSASDALAFVQFVYRDAGLRFAETGQTGRRKHRELSTMPEHVYKVVELVGSSEESVTKAIDRAISKAADSIRHLGWFEVVQVRGHIEDGKVAQYQVTIKAGFRIEDS